MHVYLYSLERQDIQRAKFGKVHVCLSCITFSLSLSAFLSVPRVSLLHYFLLHHTALGKGITLLANWIIIIPQISSGSTGNATKATPS